MSRIETAASLTWDGCGDPVDTAVLEEHEHALGFQLPGDLRAVLGRCHGGTPVERSDFEFYHPDLGDSDSGVGALVTLEADDVDSMLSVWRDLQAFHGVPREIVPFATDGGGDFMCLDYREDPMNPRIVYWAHEADPDRAIAFLADSFTAFLAMLEPPEPLPDE